MRNQNYDSTELFVEQKSTPSRQTKFGDLMPHTSNKIPSEDLLYNRLVKVKDLSKYPVDVICSILQPLEVQKMKLFQCIRRLDRIITITENQKIDLISKLKHVEDTQQNILSKVVENKARSQDNGPGTAHLQSFSKTKIDTTTNNEACIPIKLATNSISSPGSEDRQWTEITKPSTKNDSQIKISNVLFQRPCNKTKDIKGNNLRSIPNPSALHSDDCVHKFENRTLNILQIRNKCLEKDAGIDRRMRADMRNKFRKQNYPNDDLLQNILMKFHSVKQCIDKYKNQQRCETLTDRIPNTDHHRVDSKETFINNWILSNHAISSLTYNTNGMSKTLPKASNSSDESLNDVHNLSYSESEELKSTYVKDSCINQLQNANQMFDNSSQS